MIIRKFIYSLIIIFSVSFVFVKSKLDNNRQIYLDEVFQKNILTSSPKNDDEPITTVENVVDFGSNHKIIDLSGDMNDSNYSPMYHYEVYNNDDVVVLSETEGFCPKIIYLTKSLMSISWGAGTETWLTQYYNIKEDIFSEIFVSPLEMHNNKVAYSDYSVSRGETLLIVRHVFDKSRYYKEFYLEDLSEAASPIRKVTFINNTEIKVTYLAGNDYEKKSVILKLD
jgi:hypothetical protein